jgi:hypothetical protein
VETAIIEFRDDSDDGRLVEHVGRLAIERRIGVYSFSIRRISTGLGTHMIVWPAIAARRGLPSLSRLLDRRLEQDGLQACLPPLGILRAGRLDGVA